MRSPPKRGQFIIGGVPGEREAAERRSFSVIHQRRVDMPASQAHIDVVKDPPSLARLTELIRERAEFYRKLSALKPDIDAARKR
jgi:hypothetical protein